MLGAIGALNRLELAGETLRAALEALAAAAPGWLAEVIDEWRWHRSLRRSDDLVLPPQSRPARKDLHRPYGGDGYSLLEQVHGPGAPGWLRELPAVQALRRIWIQHFYREVTEGGREVISGGRSSLRGRSPAGQRPDPPRMTSMPARASNGRFRLGLQGPLHRDLRRSPALHVRPGRRGSQAATGSAGAGAQDRGHDRAARTWYSRT